MDLNPLASPVLFRGDARTAYPDPPAIYHDGVFHLMFFHGSAYPEKDPRGGFGNFASLGTAYSDDLKTWEWPGKSKPEQRSPGIYRTSRFFFTESRGAVTRCEG